MVVSFLQIWLNYKVEQTTMWFGIQVNSPGEALLFSIQLKTKLSRLKTKSAIKFVVLAIRSLQSGLLSQVSGAGVSLNRIILINSDWTGTDGSVTGHKSRLQKKA